MKEDPVSQKLPPLLQQHEVHPNVRYAAQLSKHSTGLQRYCGLKYGWPLPTGMDPMSVLLDGPHLACCHGCTPYTAPWVIQCITQRA